MPSRTTIARARKAARQGKAPTTQAGEFVREEIHHVRRGKHGARSAKQTIAIGLAKARRAGVQLAPPPGKRAHQKTHPAPKPSARRSRATLEALRREGRKAASTRALSRAARGGTRRRRRRKRGSRT